MSTYNKSDIIADLNPTIYHFFPEQCLIVSKTFKVFFIFQSYIYKIQSTTKASLIFRFLACPHNIIAYFAGQATTLDFQKDIR